MHPNKFWGAKGVFPLGSLMYQYVQLVVSRVILQAIVSSGQETRAKKVFTPEIKGMEVLNPAECVGTVDNHCFQDVDVGKPTGMKAVNHQRREADGFLTDPWNIAMLRSARSQWRADAYSLVRRTSERFRKGSAAGAAAS